MGEYISEIAPVKHGILVVREGTQWKGTFQGLILAPAQSVRKGVPLETPMPYLRLHFPISRDEGS